MTDYKQGWSVSFFSFSEKYLWTAENKAQYQKGYGLGKDYFGKPFKGKDWRR